MTELILSFSDRTVHSGGVAELEELVSGDAREQMDVLRAQVSVRVEVRVDSLYRRGQEKKKSNSTHLAIMGSGQSMITFGTGSFGSTSVSHHLAIFLCSSPLNRAKRIVIVIFRIPICTINIIVLHVVLFCLQVDLHPLLLVMNPEVAAPAVSPVHWMGSEQLPGQVQLASLVRKVKNHAVGQEKGTILECLTQAGVGL